MKYNTETGKFIDADGDEVDHKLIGAVNFTTNTANNGQSQALADKELCVALSISFEFQEQMPCHNPKDPGCSWSFFRYVPANCNNYHGSICQHWDHWGSKNYLNFFFVFANRFKFFVNN